MSLAEHALGSYSIAMRVQLSMYLDHIISQYEPRSAPVNPSDYRTCIDIITIGVRVSQARGSVMSS